MVTFCAALVAGCGGSSSPSQPEPLRPEPPPRGGNPTNNLGDENRAPSAEVTASHRSVAEGDRATLDGSGSSDPEPGVLAYSWSQEEGPDVVLHGDQTAEATFVAPAVVRETLLRFRLTVTDAGGLTAEATVEVVVTDTPPEADAGDDRRATSGDEVRLEGRGIDTPGTGSVTYRWEQEEGPDVVLDPDDGAVAAFTAPDVGEETRLAFRLTVANAGGLTSEDVVWVIVEPTNEPTTAPTNEPTTAPIDEPPPAPVNQAPVATFTVSPTSGHPPLEITLDGTRSHDPDGSIVEYFWEYNTVQPGANTVGYYESASEVKFYLDAVGTYEVWLRVQDDDGTEARSSLPHTIVVAPPDTNLPPQDLSITVEKVYNVPLTYRFSAQASDVDGHIVDYEWQFTADIGEWIPNVSGREVTHSFEHLNVVLHDDHLSPGGTHRVQVDLYVTDDDDATTRSWKEIQVERDHIFAGQQDLLDRLEVVGGPFGTLYLRDGAVHDPESHGYYMYRAIRQMSIPPDNIAPDQFVRVPGAFVFQGRPVDYLISQADGMLRQNLLVGAAPLTEPYSNDGSIEAIGALNMVWVMGTSNAPLYQECPDNGRGVDSRDYWNIEHPYWSSCFRGNLGYEAGFPEIYHKTLEVIATGKVLVAGTATIRSDGTVEPNRTTGMCGDLKEYCFAVPSVRTSSTSIVVLGALMYLFMQMYDDPATAVAALKNCTRDVGEPGVDREYGQGIVDLRFCSEAQLPIIDRDPSPNQPPIARIGRVGGDITVVDGNRIVYAVDENMVTLDGSGSSDPEGGPLLYHWKQAPRVDAAFIRPSEGIGTARAIFKARTVQDPNTFRDKITTERIRLFVTDEDGLTGYDEITVEVRPHN